LINKIIIHYLLIIKKLFFKDKNKTLDDGIEEDYQYRLKEYEKYNLEIATDIEDAFYCIDGDYFKVPKEIWEKLYK